MNNSIFGKDTPMGCPDVNDRAAVFVPAAGREKDLPATIKNGAGIAGYGNNDGTLTIYFESNRFDDPRYQSWIGKVKIAYERMVNHLPTIAHLAIAPDMMEQVGFIDGSGLQVIKRESMQRWLAFCRVSDTAPEADMTSWSKK